MAQLHDARARCVRVDRATCACAQYVTWFPNDSFNRVLLSLSVLSNTCCYSKT